jgi:hypothetical protein
VRTISADGVNIHELPAHPVKLHKWQSLLRDTFISAADDYFRDWYRRLGSLYRACEHKRFHYGVN